MRKVTLLVFVFIALGANALGQEQKVYRIYDAKQVVVPSYIVKQRPDGSYAVYPSGKPVLSKYIIRNGRVYDSRNPVLPIKEIKPWKSKQSR